MLYSDVGEHAHTTHCQVINHPYGLPFEKESFDWVICAHVHECFDDPMPILKDIYRVLKPQGRITIFGIKRFGPWGIEHQWNHALPWVRHCYSELAMRDMAARAGFDHDITFRHGHLPLLLANQEPSRWRRLDALIGLVFPYASAAYAMVACKDRKPLDPMLSLHVVKSGARG